MSSFWQHKLLKNNKVMTITPELCMNYTSCTDMQSLHIGMQNRTLSLSAPLLCKTINSLPPILNSPRHSGAAGSSEGEGIGLPWLKSPRLLLLDLGSRATRLLAPVSLGMPACSLEEIEEIGLAPPKESFTLSPSSSFSLPLSHHLCLSQENHNRVLYTGAKQGGFRWQPSMIFRRTEG